MKKPLSDDEVHIWQCSVADCPPSLTACLSLLSLEEQRRHGAFHFEKDRTLYLVAHSLVRLVLSAYTDIPPRQIAFRCNAYGKPELHPQLTPPLHFNLTHTTGFVACAVGRQELGIDAECMERGCGLDLAKQVFAPPEYALVAALSSDQMSSRFFDFWTLKEAFIKAKGLGLSMDLQSFWFADPASQTSISFARQLNENPNDWQFQLFEPAPQLRMALAVRSGGVRKSIIVLNASTLLTNLPNH